MGLDAWLGVAHLAGVVAWVGGLLAPALTGRGGGRIHALVAGPGAFVAIFTGVWLLHRAPGLLTMSHMHVKAAAVIALGALDHLYGRGALPGPLKARAPRVVILVGLVALAGAASLAGPEGA